MARPDGLKSLVTPCLRSQHHVPAAETARLHQGTPRLCSLAHTLLRRDLSPLAPGCLAQVGRIEIVGEEGGGGRHAARATPRSHTPRLGRGPGRGRGRQGPRVTSLFARSQARPRRRPGGTVGRWVGAQP